jgi:tetratricopeptide (TPR) repeat protein
MKTLTDELNIRLKEVKEELKELLEREVPVHRAANPKKILARIEEESRCSIQAYQQDLNHIGRCLLEHIVPEEGEAVGKIFGKFQSYILACAGISPQNPLDEQDFTLLNAIATRTLSQNYFEHASSIWRLIIQCNPAYSRAWVGWAIAEHDLGHDTIVEQIYHLGLACLPQDRYILSFAVDYFLAENQKEKARKIVESALEEMNKMAHPEASDI